jgi:sortase A
MGRIRQRLPVAAGLAAVLAAGLLTGCGGADAEQTPVAVTPAASLDGGGDAVRSGSPTPPSKPSSEDPAETSASTDPTTVPPDAVPEPRRSWLSVPALGLRELAVVRYRGRPDDAQGTRIQNRGPAASPRGPRGGVGPGEVGNFIVTGHRTSHSAPFAELPRLRRGDSVRVRSGPTVYRYRITTTRSTSFRSERSRARQEAAVPGRPGATPSRAMITLSTCATPEDHAAGNFWSDRFGNPEHRIDKVGVLVGVRRG